MSGLSCPRWIENYTPDRPVKPAAIDFPNGKLAATLDRFEAFQELASRIGVDGLAQELNLLPQLLDRGTMEVDFKVRLKEGRYRNDIQVKPGGTEMHLQAKIVNGHLVREGTIDFNPPMSKAGLVDIHQIKIVQSSKDPTTNLLRIEAVVTRFKFKKDVTREQTENLFGKIRAGDEINGPLSEIVMMALKQARDQESFDTLKDPEPDVTTAEFDVSVHSAASGEICFAPEKVPGKAGVIRAYYDKIDLGILTLTDLYLETDLSSFDRSSNSWTVSIPKATMSARGPVKATGLRVENVVARLGLQDPNNPKTFYLKMASGQISSDGVSVLGDLAIGPVKGARFLVTGDAGKNFSASLYIPELPLTHADLILGGTTAVQVAGASLDSLGLMCNYRKGNQSLDCYLGGTPNLPYVMVQESGGSTLFGSAICNFSLASLFRLISQRGKINTRIGCNAELAGHLMDPAATVTHLSATIKKLRYTSDISVGQEKIRFDRLRLSGDSVVSGFREKYPFSGDLGFEIKGQADPAGSPTPEVSTGDAKVFFRSFQAGKDLDVGGEVEGLVGLVNIAGPGSVFPEWRRIVGSTQLRLGLGGVILKDRYSGVIAVNDDNSGWTTAQLNGGAHPSNPEAGDQVKISLGAAADLSESVQTTANGISYYNHDLLFGRDIPLSIAGLAVYLPPFGGITLQGKGGVTLNDLKKGLASYWLKLPIKKSHLSVTEVARVGGQKGISGSVRGIGGSIEIGGDQGGFRLNLVSPKFPIGVIQKKGGETRRYTGFLAPQKPVTILVRGQAVSLQEGIQDFKGSLTVSLLETGGKVIPEGEVKKGVEITVSGRSYISGFVNGKKVRLVFRNLSISTTNAKLLADLGISDLLIKKGATGEGSFNLGKVEIDIDLETLLKGSQAGG